MSATGRLGYHAAPERRAGGEPASARPGAPRMMGLARAPLVDAVIRATRVDRPLARSHAVAVGLALAALLLGLWLRPLLGVSVPFVLFLPAVMFAAWFGGLRPGLAATGLTAVAALAIFEHPALNAGAVIRPLAFLLLGGGASVLGEVLHEARREQERSLRRAARLIELRSQLDELVMTLPEPLSVSHTADILLSQGCALLGAPGARLQVMERAGDDDVAPSLRTVSAVGDGATDFDAPLLQAVRLQAPVVLDGVAALPLLLRGRALGGIAFSFPESRPFHETDLPVLQSLAYQAALALDSVRRYEEEQAARRQAEALGERHRFLAGANACLAVSLDYEANLREVCRLAVPAFAHGCFVHLRNAEGGMSLISAAHAEPGGAAALEEQGRAFGDTEDFWQAIAARRPALQEPGSALGAALAVPLVARDRAVGMITFVGAPGAAGFEPGDVELGRELAERAASAVDNAQLFAEARRLNRVKDEFLALLSHELRTPLGSALVWLELLRAESLEPSALRAVEMTHRSARQLAELIDQLLDMSRTVAGKLSIEKQPVELPALVEGVVAAARPAAEAKGVELAAEIDRSFHRLWADPNRIRQALANVVSNAIKFTPRGGRVDVTLEHAGSVARLRVRDTGAGIARDVLPFVFERFRLGDARSTRAQGGLGLGLTIAQYIVDQHEGTLRAQSEGPGQGSLFILDLPLREPPGLPAVPLLPPVMATPLGSLRVLLVDDHRETLQGLAAGLKASGAEVTPVSSVREALQALPEVRPHVVVSDLAMPGQDGFALIDHIRRLAPEAGGLVPAVAVSASASPADRVRALREGYQEHMAKPVELGRLVATIERLTSPRPARGA
jgi:signal transduction histidine kinase/CheY-like chemotaxis protein